jgi:hypothetical protein
LTKKHPVIRNRFIDWEGCENIGDADMTPALRNLERKGLKNIMAMEYPWNDEVIAQFYATLWVKKVDEEDDGYDYCWNLLSVARRPTGVNSVDSRVTRGMANSSVNQASHGHCAGVFIGT